MDVAICSSPPECIQLIKEQDRPAERFCGLEHLRQKSLALAIPVNCQRGGDDRSAGRRRKTKLLQATNRQKPPSISPFAEHSLERDIYEGN